MEQIINWISFFDKFFYGLIIIFLFWLGGRFSRNFIMRFGVRTHLNQDVINMLSKGSHIFLLIVGWMTALGTMGVDVKAMLTGLGLTGFAVGFAIKDVLSNWLAGLLTLVYEPFHRGDYLTITNPPGGLEGEVVSIDFRYTILKRKDGKLVLVPNSNLLTKEIIVGDTEVACPSI